MKTNGFEYEVKANVVFTGEELDKLSQMSARHYDGRCKVAGQPGGFLYGFWNQFLVLTGQFDTEGVDMAKECEIACTFQQLDILAKIAEQENGYIMMGNIPIRGDLGFQLSGILRGINEEYGRVNDDGQSATA